LITAFIYLDIELKNSLQFEKCAWYPNDLVWTLNIDKYKFKKSRVFENLHKFIDHSAEAGLITR
jgi:hypothetical protein